MAVFKAKDANVEVFGNNILAIINTMGAFKQTAFKILEDCGIENPQPDQWYKVQSFLDAFKILHEKLGDATLKVIGMKIPELAKLPPEIKGVDTILKMMDQAFYMNHKGGDIGHFTYTKVGDKEVSLTVDNPYPCPFDKGLLQGFTEKFREPGSIPIVRHDPGSCRMEGGHACKYTIKW